jgi:hypothetical protein
MLSAETFLVCRVFSSTGSGLMDVLESLLQTQLGVFGKLREHSALRGTPTLAGTTTCLPCGCSTQFHTYFISLARPISVAWRHCLNYNQQHCC